MSQRLLISLFVTVFITTLLPQATLAAPRCFAEAGPAIRDCIDGRIRSFWEAQGGLPVFGYPLTAAYTEQSNNGPITVQLFERARLEHHPRNRAPYDILLGRLGADRLGAQATTAPREQSRPECIFFEQTGYNVCGAFLAAWKRYGIELGRPGITADESLALFGVPISPAQPMTLADGTTRTVQWFERARLEDHGANGVLFGLLGRELADAQPEILARAPQIERGGFIQASGSQLTRLGQPVQIKGINYYPQGRPWAEMWAYWDGQQTMRELRLAREQLGINTIRILLPYDIRDVSSGTVTERLLTRLREIVQIAGDLEIRVIVTLFDFYDGFPLPGTPEEERNFVYLRQLIGNFAGDDRIMAWDLHNEPDHYPTWKEGRAPQALTWLGRMADEVDRLAPNHLVTVGMGQYDRLWAPGPDGRRVIDYSDVISVHNYNAADMARQLDELRSYTKKPIILGEFGWPSGPQCSVRGYTEAQQAVVYQELLRAAAGRVAGVVAWTLRDYDSGPTRRWDTREEHYGLFRADGTLKPAAQALRDYAAPPLPSNVDTTYALTVEMGGTPGGRNAPLLIAESGHYVKGTFRRVWELLGGKASLGLPLTEAFVRPEDQRVVQYFEAGVLELLIEDQVSTELPLEEQLFLIKQRIRPASLGMAYGLERYPPNQAAGGIRLAEATYKVGSSFNGLYNGIDGKWRLGTPISDEIVEAVNGVATRVQYFQHGRMELNPSSGAPEVSRLGRWAFEMQCKAVGG